MVVVPIDKMADVYDSGDIDMRCKALANLRKVKEKRPFVVTNRLMLSTPQSNVSKRKFQDVNRLVL